MTTGSCSCSKKCSGFTLIEVLAAMAIAMGVLYAIGLIYYSVATAWISHREGDHVLQHQHSIFAFLEDQLSIQQELIAPGYNAENSGVEWRKLPEAGEYEPYYLSWWMKNPPVFVQWGEWWDGFGARCYLEFDRNSGLALIWHPEDPKIEQLSMGFPFEVEDYMFRFHLSSEVLQLEYAYYDGEKDEWENLSALSNQEIDEKGLPVAVIFEVEEREVIRRSIYLSGSTGGEDES